MKSLIIRRNGTITLCAEVLKRPICTVLPRIRREVRHGVKQEIMEYLEDCSEEGMFQYRIRCENCGKLWYSGKKKFSHAHIVPKTEGKRIIYQTLYQREQKEAFLQAAQEAREVFSCCPICGHLVCDACFLLCDEIEMCSSCAARLEEEGIPVTGMARDQEEGTDD